MACLFINCNPVYFYSIQMNGANVSFNIHMVNRVYKLVYIIMTVLVTWNHKVTIGNLDSRIKRRVNPERINVQHFRKGNVN